MENINEDGTMTLKPKAGVERMYKNGRTPVYPMLYAQVTRRFKGVLNMQYATNLNKWIFDFTASLNGSCRVYNFMEPMYENGRTPVYPLLYAQITRRFKGWDVYVGAENLTNFRQKDVIIGSVKDANGYVNPYQASYDASCIWGPLMGFKAHAGFRFTLWKKA